MCVSDLLLRMARIDAIHTKAFEHQPTPPNKEYIFPEASGLSYFTINSMVAWLRSPTKAVSTIWYSGTCVSAS